MEWIALTEELIVEDFPTELRPVYDAWLTDYPEKAGRLASIISNTAAEIRALIASNPVNQLDVDETKIPRSLLRQAETLIFFALSMEMGVSVAPEANQSMIRAEMTLRTLVYNRYLVSTGAAADAPSPHYNPDPEPPEERSLPSLALVAAMLLATALPVRGAWIKPSSWITDTSVNPTYAPAHYTNTTTTLYGHLEGIDDRFGDLLQSGDPRFVITNDSRNLTFSGSLSFGSPLTGIKIFDYQGPTTNTSSLLSYSQSRFLRTVFIGYTSQTNWHITFRHGSESVYNYPIIDFVDTSQGSLSSRANLSYRASNILISANLDLVGNNLTVSVVRAGAIIGPVTEYDAAALSQGFASSNNVLLKAGDTATGALLTTRVPPADFTDNELVPAGYALSLLDTNWHTDFSSESMAGGNPTYGYVYRQYTTILGYFGFTNGLVTRIADWDVLFFTASSTTAIYSTFIDLCPRSSPSTAQSNCVIEFRPVTPPSWSNASPFAWSMLDTCFDPLTSSFSTTIVFTVTHDYSAGAVTNPHGVVIGPSTLVTNSGPFTSLGYAPPNRPVLGTWGLMWRYKWTR